MPSTKVLAGVGVDDELRVSPMELLNVPRPTENCHVGNLRNAFDRFMDVVLADDAPNLVLKGILIPKIQRLSVANDPARHGHNDPVPIEEDETERFDR